MQSGYAFLHFASTTEGLKSAITAVEEGNLLIMDNITYQCKVTHSLQAKLNTARQKEVENLEKRYHSPSLTHAFPTLLDDSTFKTYNSPAQCASPKYFIPSVVNKYPENFPSYNMSPKMTMSRSELPYEVLPPPLSPNLRRLNSAESDELRSPFSNTNQNIVDLIYPAFTIDNGASTYTDISQTYLNNDSHHLPARLLSSSFSLSSMFINPTYEDPSMKKNYFKL